MPAHSLLFWKKTPRGPPGLTSPSDGGIAINSIICLLNIHLAIRKCTSPPLLAPRLKILKCKIYYHVGDRTPDLLNQRQTCYHLNQRIFVHCTCFLDKYTCEIQCFPTNIIRAVSLMKYNSINVSKF